MKPQAGDTIVVESEKVAQPHRRGTIEEVLQHDPPRLRVRWDDGHTSIFTPSTGAATVAHPRWHSWGRLASTAERFRTDPLSRARSGVGCWQEMSDYLVEVEGQLATGAVSAQALVLVFRAAEEAEDRHDVRELERAVELT